MPAPKVKKLTPKQKLFVAEYLKDLNATQAAIRAGYSKKTARFVGSENLTKPYISSAIDHALTQRIDRVEVDADWVLKRLAEEAEADLADLYQSDGGLKPVEQWPLIWRQGLVAGIETVQEYESVDGKKEPAGIVQKVRLSDRIKRIELLGKHISVGAFSEKHVHTGKDGGPIQVTEIERRIVKA